MKLKLTRLNDQLAFQAANEDGQQIRIDASAAAGGQGLGMRPMEILASSLASCASIDVLLILKKKRIALEAYEVHVSAVRKEAVPAVFETIHLEFVVAGTDPLEEVGKAVKLSVEKYCSVAGSLHPEIKITYEVRQEKRYE